VSSFIGRLRYFVVDAYDEWRHSPGVNLLATSTLAAVLFLAGLVLLLLANLEGHLERMRTDIRVEVYLSDGITGEQLTALESRLRDEPGVSRVEYIDKDEALRRFRKWSADSADLTAELGENPLPASFEVYIATERAASEFAAALTRQVSGEQGVEEIRYDRKWIDRLEALLNLARVGGVLVAGMVFAAVVFVIASVLRLAVYARRDEIEIMMLVGATPGFVRGPFLVAGLAQGLVASAVALLAVEVMRLAVQANAGSGIGLLLSLATSRPLGWLVVFCMLLCGMAVGFAGSYLAVWGHPSGR